ncbi:Clp protease N-terminal domain-containing protein [Actinomadura sp. WAC 06369]|uniref:Clp protease N-terminal domain-containing protein n=1 Tax=Actinomadura sp. WAC 06369 TaxID=2203193 RepID=UPI000F78F31F|nr:Clp protease N-terminal domain-containing protein [Actinomadura sp. WAC 06369]RSN48488.1 hypothetical protein DMH08_33935 [Actinomadura sp. WAC 06369]
MFERFTKDARQTVVDAQAQARDLGHGRIGTEHVLLALLDADDSTARALRAHGLEAAALRARVAAVGGLDGDLDPDALRSIGIDLDAVRRAAEDSFGEGALDAAPGERGRRKGHRPFGKEAKKALELSLRHAIRLKHNYIGTGHILLGLLHDDDFRAVRLVWESGADVAELRADITRMLTSKAA